MKVFNAFVASLFMISLFFGACNQKAADKTPDRLSTENPDSMEAYLDYAHIALSKSEEKIINQYVKRHEWKLIKTPSGLRYAIYSPGKGANAEPGQLVKIRYEIQLINGIVVASSDQDGILEIVIGRSEAPGGLHEMLQLMNTGCKAKAIIPSYLAYGFTGDQDRIPKGATLVYDIEMLQIHNLK